MSIRGRRDSEPQAEEHQSQAAADDGQAEARDARESATEHQAEEPAPAFWRAQGETPASLERDPADAPVLTGAQEPTLTGAGPAAAAITPQRWSEILVSFVDDPRGSVQMAADAVDEAIDAFVNSVRATQRVLASSWQDTGTGTEQLRTALRDYRRFWHQVQQLDLGEKTGA